MDIQNTLQRIGSGGMSTRLGMQFFSTADAHTLRGTMPVDEYTCQPFGILNGGASAALAETIAGIGSCTLCPNSICMGTEVCCHHVATTHIGDEVNALATIISQGRTLHLWHITITRQDGTLVSDITVRNYIRPKPNKE